MRARCAIEASSCPYDSVDTGLRGGNATLSIKASRHIAPAEMKNTACHEAICAMKLETGRANMMPSISPLITLPTTAPRTASGARCAA